MIKYNLNNKIPTDSGHEVLVMMHFGESVLVTVLKNFKACIISVPLDSGNDTDRSSVFNHLKILHK